MSTARPRSADARLHVFTMQVLTKEVKSNDIQLLFENPRSLLREVLVDMKCHGASIARPDWRIRRQYKWCARAPTFTVSFNLPN
eukprot:4441438-Pleurochrysis_carterae.AAC.2